jgi:hypothetical protein
MPTDIADIVTAVTSVIGGIVPMTTVGLLAFFGFVVAGGTMLVKRMSKALR